MLKSQKKRADFSAHDIVNDCIFLLIARPSKIGRLAFHQRRVAAQASPAREQENGFSTADLSRCCRWGKTCTAAARGNT
ncbi:MULTISPECIES: hypothetical protein [unclassified Mesorhizobium]|uniref:hypothetical protein n=1 Tax=unclassified Mesorhizobium TaxID=325217 RepID=UPI000FE7196E|nr:MULTISPECIES: hypothetical protein [unclassified Mesorhizobium]RWF16622.1 MAG: hypothetical protein EOS64_24750 [Mesorhizobium sp.]TGS63833.1 hypothetical protein EN844_23010 [Mesorhizobium sp. M3A.F.Ca.ET.201.01.1.1]TGT24369.1 hypothetical protein EN817_19085 [Mesorhizobium sp. M3A.F.Ca.ET.174.01.1.1]TGT54247.1 hypothetical protein EN813_044260 [Mesorhizobium sp. M00.F.Ca.ET.170.01.1.1]TGS86261.1 hypothetical protein EN818_16940 [Mesorhizobium sp. M3A.F.Ca.ET.175.01.1.1]